MGRRTPLAVRMLRHTDRVYGEANEGRPDLGRCWEWTGATNTNGYGVVKVAGRLELAHRMALALALGRPIREGMHALHACDNRRCVRPRHLSEGTREENMADCVARGRHVGFETRPSFLEQLLAELEECAA